VLDALANLQTQINDIDGFLDYQGTWDASTNTPTLVSSTGTKGDYYVVSVAGSTTLDGESSWGVGDWVVFNNNTWQKVDGGSTGNLTTAIISTSLTLSYGTASTALALDASKNVVSVANTGTGDNVLATSPTLITPALGTPSALVGTNITGTAAGLSIGGNAATATTATNVSGGSASVTTLTTSSTVTHNGGTANGVAYLDGSKVLTTGSALTFDGTKLGVGTASPSSLLSGSNTNVTIEGTAGGDIAFKRSGGTARMAVGVTSSDVGYLWTSTNTPILFGTSATEQMRLTSTGLGIGTSSPTAKLEVAGVSAGGSAASGTTGSLVLRSRETIDFTRLSIGALHSSGAIYIGRAVEPSTTVIDGFNGGLTGTTGGGAWVIDGDGSTRFLGLPSGAMTKGSAVTPTERLRISSTGNVGIGTSSPAAKLDVVNASGRAARIGGFQLSGTTSSADGGNNLLSSGAFWNGTNFTATQTTSATVQFGNGVINFYTESGLTPSGTYSGTVRATLDSSGNLGLGVTPSVWESAYKAVQIGAGGSIAFGSSNAGAGFIGANVYADSAGTERYIASSRLAAKIGINTGAFQWFTAPSGTAGNAISFTQAMTLTAAGDLSVGTTTANTRFTVAGTGQLLTGTTRGTAEVVQDFTTKRGLHLGYDSSGQIGVIAANSAGAGSNLAFWTYSGSAWGERMRLDSSGNLLVGLTSATGVAKLQVSGAIRTTGFTVATLPAGTVGMRTYVTDALAPSFGVAVAGSGAVTIPVFYDGANWIVA
jgi:hypothetical protein